MSEINEREKLSYEEFGVAVRELGRTILLSDVKPDIILSIARGGFFLGAGLGYAIDVKNSFTLSVEFYTGIDERLPMPIVLPPVPNLIRPDCYRHILFRLVICLRKEKDSA